MNQLQQRVAPENTHQHQHQAQHTAGNHSGVDSGFHIVVVPGSEELGHNHRAADVAAKGEGNENQSNLIAVAHGGQGILADEPTGHPAIRNVIQLLEEDTAKQGQAEPPQHAGRLAGG